VLEVLNLYKEGRIKNKVTVQRELNRYLGQSFRNEVERNLYYYKTLSEHLAKALNLESSVENTQKIDGMLDGIDHRRAELLIKHETSTSSKKGAYSTIHIELNTKPAFKDMPDEEDVEITEGEYQSWQVKDEYDDLTKLPNGDTIFHTLKARVRRIIAKKLGEIDEKKEERKGRLGYFLQGLQGGDARRCRRGQTHLQPEGTLRANEGSATHQGQFREGY
jgi:hypothetical protein